MGLQSSLKKLQDKVKDSGWRIKTIPWKKDNRPEYIYNTPLTLLLSFGGVIIFFASITIVVNKIMPVWFISIGIAGLSLIFISRIYAAFHKHKNWLPVKAKCLDKEIRKGYASNGDTGRSIVYAYRLICEFNFKGQNHKVTPECTKTIAFKTIKDVEKYLSKNIDENNFCKIWINPENPLQCCFYKRPWI